MTHNSASLIASAVRKVNAGLKDGTLRPRLCRDCGDLNQYGHSCAIRENRLREVGAGENHGTVRVCPKVENRTNSPVPGGITESANGDGCRAPLPEESVRQYLDRLRAHEIRNESR